MVFKALKKYLTHTPTLAKSLENDELELYLTVTLFFKVRIKASNNQVKYEALIRGLNLSSIRLFKISDSKLVVNQVLNQFQAKEENMKAYLNKIRTLLEIFREWQQTHISRRKNQLADVLTKLALSLPVEFVMSTRIEVVKSPSINEGLSVLPVAFHDDQMDSIITYLKEKKLPKDKFKDEKQRLRVTRYLMNGEIFYKRDLSMPYLRCILPEEAEYV